MDDRTFISLAVVQQHVTSLLTSSFKAKIQCGDTVHGQSRSCVRIKPINGDILVYDFFYIKYFVNKKMHIER